MAAARPAVTRAAAGTEAIRRLVRQSAAGVLSEAEPVQNSENGVASVAAVRRLVAAVDRAAGGHDESDGLIGLRGDFEPPGADRRLLELNGQGQQLREFCFFVERFRMRCHHASV